MGMVIEKGIELFNLILNFPSNAMSADGWWYELVMIIWSWSLFIFSFFEECFEFSASIKNYKERYNSDKNLSMWTMYVAFEPA